VVWSPTRGFRALPASATVLVAVAALFAGLGALLWVDLAFDAVPLRYATDPEDGCRSLLPATRAAIDRGGAPPLVLLTASMLTGALLLASGVRHHLSAGAGRAATVGVVGSALVGAALCWAIHADDGFVLLFALIGGGFVFALAWTVALLIVRRRAVRLRDSGWLLLLWLLPILLVVVLPFAVASLTPTHEALACPGALD
jgi:hypothetical protein